MMTNGVEEERVLLATNGEQGMLNVEKGRWHSSVCLERSVNFESKNGEYAPLAEDEVM